MVKLEVFIVLIESAFGIGRGLRSERTVVRMRVLVSPYRLALGCKLQGLVAGSIDRITIILGLVGTVAT